MTLPLVNPWPARYLIRPGCDMLQLCATVTGIPDVLRCDGGGYWNSYGYQRILTVRMQSRVLELFSAS